MDQAQAKVKLETRIQENLDTSREVVARVMNEFPTDSIVRAQALRFDMAEERHRAGKLIMSVGTNYHNDGEGWSLHPHALRQVAERVGVPTAYAVGLADGEGWQRELVAEIFNRSYAREGANVKNLVRSVNGQVRGFLSDKFRRLDSRPIFDAFLGAARAAGAMPFHGTALDVRCALKMIVPVVRTIKAPWTDPHGAHAMEEFVAFGVEISNSDYGAGTLSVRAFILRLVCLNGAIAEDAMREVHLGGRLSEDLQLSQKTYDLDTRTMTSAVQDVVKGSLGPAKIDSLIARVEAAQAQEVKWDGLKARLAKALTKEELRRADEAFNGPDVENLPPGSTLWRASNAVSWILQTSESPARKLELEKLAGGLLDNKVVVEAQAA